MFQLRADYAIHEGGTKYYQVFSIIDEHSGNCCVVTHWGAYKAGAPRAPKHHGQAIKVDVYKRSVSLGRASAIIRAKSRRGYGNWDTYKSAENDTDAFATILESWFKKGDVELIMSHLVGMDEPPEEDPLDELLGSSDEELYDKREARRQEIEIREEKKRAEEAAKELARNKLLEDERYGAW